MTERRHVHLDAVGGIAGDMFVAALLDAFPELQPRVLADVAAVLPPECGRANLELGTSGGMRALRFGLRAEADRSRPLAAAPTDTSFRGLAARIREARLHEGTADAAIAILTGLAQAEARIHDVALDAVHFHELADWDSLVDVVAAGSIAAALGDVRWSVSDLPLGGGRVPSAHGSLPVPAPATVELLRGFRWCDDGIAGERVTPTGAAILRHLVSDAASERGHGRLDGIGTGAGTRNLPGTANVLRALVFTAESSTASERVSVVSFEVDDMTGEEIGVAAQRLRAEPGVLDVSLGGRIGKKGRPMTSFRLLVEPGRREAVVKRCFGETTTIGLRWRAEERAALARRVTSAAVTEGAPVRVKHAVRPDGATTRKAESDDLQEIAGVEARRARKAQAEKDRE